MSKSKTPKPGSQQQVVVRRLTSNQWNDVADLCNEAAVACETGYENHELEARKKAAQWMMQLAMKAQAKADNE
jgi:hypothetical protein